MKVLFAVSNSNITDSVISRYQQRFKEIITSKNVYYFNAIINELQKDKTYDSIVISEDLEPISNSNFEAIDKFLIEKLDRISDEASKVTGEDIPIIFICSDRRTNSDKFLRSLFTMSIYNALVGNDRSINKVCDLINKPRNKKEAKRYYQIENENEVVDYISQNGKEELVSEAQMKNILSYYKKIGTNEKECVKAFDSISKQYDQTQLRLIAKMLPMQVKAILEQNSATYQKLMTGGTVLSNGNDSRYNRQNNTKLDFLEKNLEKSKLTAPVIIPSSINIQNQNKTNTNLNPNNYNQDFVKNEMAQNNYDQNFVKNEMAQNNYNDAGNGMAQNNYNQGFTSNEIMQNNYNQTAQNNNMDVNYGLNGMVNNNFESMNNKMTDNNLYSQSNIDLNAPNGQTPNLRLSNMEQNNLSQQNLDVPKSAPRGRGRPKKIRPVEETKKTDEIPTVKRGRGRPRKIVPEPINNNNLQENQLNNAENRVENNNNSQGNVNSLHEQINRNENLYEQANTNSNLYQQANTNADSYMQTNTTSNPYEQSLSGSNIYEQSMANNNSQFKSSNINESDNANNLYGMNQFDNVEHNNLHQNQFGQELQNNTNANQLGQELQNNTSANQFGQELQNNTNANQFGQEMQNYTNANQLGQELQNNTNTNEFESKNQDNINTNKLDNDGNNGFSQFTQNQQNNMYSNQFGYMEQNNNNNGFNSQNIFSDYPNTDLINNNQNQPNNPGLNYMPNSTKGKIVSFVGTTKNGTSFIVNNLAQYLSQSNVKVAILDATKNKNDYYMFTNNDPKLTKIASSCMQNLENGQVNGINVNNNLTVFTSLPENYNLGNISSIISTLQNNFDICLIDCDFETNINYFIQSNEIYLVQTMDAFTIQPLTKFLSDLKSRNVLDESKLRIVINKYVNLKHLDYRLIVGGMSKYNEPSMTLQRDLFNPNNVEVVVVPFNEKNYQKYLEEIAMCQLSLNGFTPDLINSLESLKQLVFMQMQGTSGNNNDQRKYGNYEKKEKPRRHGLFGRREKKKDINNNQLPQFSNDMNDTLNKMRNNF